ncbi:MAG TPA: DUF2586 family protein [Terriglobia bacterium]|nr:DUF2586 family protein [Terriglobia bacterium]
MGNMILPGTYIEVRAEGLIRPGPITVGNVGVVGTAAKGKVGVAIPLSSFSDAQQKFGAYDAWVDGHGDELTLVRALEQAFNHGATTVFAVRVASAANATASYTVQSASGDCVRLDAQSPGEWGNELTIKIEAADDTAFVSGERPQPPLPLKLKHPPLASARNRATLHIDATNTTRALKIVTGVPAAGEVQLDADGTMHFGDAILPADTVTASYLVDKANAVKVTIQLGSAKKVFTVVDGSDLVQDINDPNQDPASAWVKATELAHKDEKPSTVDPPAGFKGGLNGEDASDEDYKSGLDALLNEEAHIIVAAGQDDSFWAKLDQHCQTASTDSIKRDRIGVIGSRFGATLDDLRGHNIDSDRMIFVAPGIKTTDAAIKKPVILPGAYTAAAVAGMLAGLPAHVSPTNKPLSVDDLQHYYTNAELEQLVEARVFTIEKHNGFRVLKGITTTTGSAFSQVTTRRIVDYAKFGVRSAADPFIGLLNNERVRGALRASINAFLVQMVNDEMLIGYELTVTATRDEQIQGIARVTMTLQPVFSIDFIKVTMFLE